MGFPSLQHTRIRRFTSRGPKPARYVPPSGFGYPRGGFNPSSPCPPCFMRAALLGFTLRSFLLPEDCLNVSAQAYPPTVASGGMPATEAASPPAGRRFLGFQPFRESLAIDRMVSTTTAGCSLGFCPSRARGQGPFPGFRRESSLALRRSRRETRPKRPAPRSIDRPPLGLIPSRR